MPAAPFPHQSVDHRLLR